MTYKVLLELKPTIEALYVADVEWGLAKDIRELKVAWEDAARVAIDLQKKCYETNKDKGAELLQNEWEKILALTSDIVLPKLEEVKLASGLKTFKATSYDALKAADVLK